MTNDLALHVLVVDDEPLARTKLKNLLAQCPQAHVARVYEAANGEHALVTVQGCPVNVALLDVQMPGIDGVMLARQLRQQYQQLAFIFVTAYEQHALNAFEVEAVDSSPSPCGSSVWRRRSSAPPAGCRGAKARLRAVRRT